MLDPLHHASVLVTGAAGSIGSTLSLRLAALQPEQLVLLDESEQCLARLQSAFAEARANPPHLLLGNAGNAALLREIFEIYRPQIVFHAAAYKHVPLLESHPLAAIANNVLTTRTLFQCATEYGASRLVLLSTDKAVAPISILGATKQLAERISLAHNGVVLRLGNVLGTEGSVSQTFLRQIAAGGPITLTDRDAQRYFLTCEEAVDLLLRAAVETADCSVLVPAIGRQYTIASLAQFMIASRSHERTIQIKYTGLRAGDKAREALWTSREAPQRCKHGACFELMQHDAQSHSPSWMLLLDSLQDAVQARDLILAMDLVKKLVPDYEPSPSILALVQSTVLGASHR